MCIRDRGLQNVPVMAEQLALFDMGGDAPVYEAPEGNLSSPLFPAKEVPQAVIDQALYTAGNSYNSAYRVAVFYMRERPEADCIAFLRREFGKENGRGIEMCIRDRFQLEQHFGYSLR